MKEKNKVKNSRKKLNKKVLIIAVILLIILAGFTGYGYYGGKQSHSITVICDVGWDDHMCWKWHKGTISEILKELGAQL